MLLTGGSVGSASRANERWKNKLRLLRMSIRELVGLFCSLVKANGVLTYLIRWLCQATVELYLNNIY